MWPPIVSLSFYAFRLVIYTHDAERVNIRNP
jgi:hypothetical protein